VAGETTFADACEAIDGEFETGWGATTPISWPNVRFDKPAGAPWVSCTVGEAPGAVRASLGSTPLHRYFGNVTIQVFTPAERTGSADVGGAGAARELAGQAAAIFRTATGQGKQIERGQSGLITFGAPGFDPRGADGLGWYQINVMVPYHRDAVHT
jgi:hypothetical protein